MLTKCHVGYICRAKDGLFKIQFDAPSASEHIAQLCLGPVLLQDTTQRQNKKKQQTPVPQFIKVRRVTTHFQRAYFNNIRK